MLEFQVEITKGCHLACLHCSSDSKMAKEGFFFNFRALSKFLDPIKEKACVYLSGGEPLLAPELSSHVRKLSTAGLLVGLYSSGIRKQGKHYQSVTLDEARQLKDAGLSECYFSLYDINPVGHDAITNVSGSLDLTLGAIRNFISAEIDVKVHLVLNRFLFDHIDSAVDFALASGVKEVRLLSLVRSGRALAHWEKIGVDSISQMERLKSMLRKYPLHKSNVTFSGMPEHTACRPLNKEIGCVAGRKLFYITYEGDIFPCAGTRNLPAYSLGNIQSDRFINLKPFATDEGSCLNRGADMFSNSEKRPPLQVVKRVTCSKVDIHEENI